MSFLDMHRFVVGADSKTQFRNADGVKQDGTMAMYRDTDGRLFAIAGHSHSGYIAMFAG